MRWIGQVAGRQKGKVHIKSRVLFIHFYIDCKITFSMYSYCSLCILIVAYVFLDAATLTEVFPCFFLGCKANARV